MLLRGWALCVWFIGVSGFGIPQPFLTGTQTAASLLSSSFLLIADEDSLMKAALSGGASSATDAAATAAAANDLMSASNDAVASANQVIQTVSETAEPGLLESAGGIVRNIAIAITAIIFLLAGAAQLLGAVIIPAAAKELEKECLELAPELWDEYQAKLDEGQTMAQRPDLMQELGQRLQPMLDAKIAAAGNQSGIVPPPPPGGSDRSPEPQRIPLDMSNISALSEPEPTSSAPPPPPPQATIIDVTSAAGDQWDDDDDQTKK